MNFCEDCVESSIKTGAVFISWVTPLFKEGCTSQSYYCIALNLNTVLAVLLNKDAHLWCCISESSSDTPASSVPAFVFSPPQKQQPLPKPHHQSAPSQHTRVHTMALRGLHTITEESTPPSTPTSTSPPQASERDTTPIAVKKSKKFKPTPSSKTPQTRR